MLSSTPLAHFTSPRFTSPTTPRLTSPRFTSPVHSSLYSMSDTPASLKQESCLITSKLPEVSPDIRVLPPTFH